VIPWDLFSLTAISTSTRLRQGLVESVALTVLSVGFEAFNWWVLDPFWTQRSRLHPCSETFFDGHICSALSFLPVSRGTQGSGGGGDVAPSPRKFVARVRHGLKNTRVALAELANRATEATNICFAILIAAKVAGVCKINAAWASNRPS